MLHWWSVINSTGVNSKRYLSKPPWLVGSQRLRGIALTKAFRKTLSTVGDSDGEGGASQAGVWLLDRLLSPVVWATGTGEPPQMTGPLLHVRQGRSSSLTKVVLRSLLQFTLEKWWSSLIFNKLGFFFGSGSHWCFSHYGLCFWTEELGCC